MIGAAIVLRDVRTPVGYVIQESGCWEWCGAIKSNGYGTVYVDGHLMQAHRYVYELEVGPIPTGLTIDHLCRNRCCVRPEHMEPVTLRENLLRGNGASGRNARKTECKRGHPFTPDNTYRRPNGARLCRACGRIADNSRRHHGTD